MGNNNILFWTVGGGAKMLKVWYGINTKNDKAGGNAMKEFRFVILGAAGIADKFCKAAAEVGGCTVAAVASKSEARAKAFAARNGLPAYYDSYEKMLETEKPDAAYIAVTTNDHFRLTMLCLSHQIPVLCEKAMFRGTAEAGTAFAKAAERKTFAMEAMWSRFLPAVNTARQWLAEGKIGQPELARFGIGFVAEENPHNRFYDPALGGGAAFDLTVYGYELMTYLIDQPVHAVTADAWWGPTGVDLSDHIGLRFAHTQADLMTSLVAPVEERLVVCGKRGRLVLPRPHYADECFLYGTDGTELEHYKDTAGRNGFAYEIEEVMRCVRGGLLESPVVPHALTLSCAAMFDRLSATKPRA